MHHDRGVYADDILTFMHHVLPPFSGDVSLQLNAQGTVIVGALKAAVDLATLKDKASTLSEGDDLG
jgi:hypothetical protein